MENAVLRVGTTEGRFRMIMPELLGRFAASHPEIRIEGMIGNAEELRKGLEEGRIDLAFSGISPLAPACIEKELLFEERLYLVLSDGLLQKHFGPEADGVIRSFRNGAELSRLGGIPFCRSLPNLHCMQILEHLLLKEGIALDCIHVSPHFDLHQQMAAADYAGCFCLSMYVDHLRQLNKTQPNHLYLFPIRGLEETNPVYLLRNGDLPLPEGWNDFAELLREVCKPLDSDLSD